MRALERTVAVVAGATRGAGRGIACMLGEAGATVYCTGRSIREKPSTKGRAETIDETAEMVAVRIAELLAPELRPHGITAVAVTPGFLRTEAMLEAFGVTESNWRDAVKKDPYCAGSETLSATASRVGHIDRSHSLRCASPRSQCADLCRSRTPEPTLCNDRWFLSVCYLKAEFRVASCNVSGKIVEVRLKMMFREQ